MANATPAVRLAIDDSGYATQRRVLGNKLGRNEPQFRINSVSVFSLWTASFFPQESLRGVAISAAMSRQIGHIGEDRRRNSAMRIIDVESAIPGVCGQMICADVTRLSSGIRALLSECRAADQNG
ncbi:hypothetical protein ACQR1Y_15400 [Bradyrhizobium sp. HKCCYLRH3099]|uniref:hypothetical protein n=1 Tax=unclassified Bradyrhizobium TaxID=2631580 RepID=UPI003EBE899D